MTNCRISQSGNVLFLILIAVALFAALSFAVTSSTRTSGGDARRDSLKAEIGSLLGYTAGLRVAIQRMAFNSGTSGNQLMYNNNAYQNNNGTIRVPMPAAPANPVIHVFHPSGGGQSPLVFKRLSEMCSGSSCTDTNSVTPGHGFFSYVNLPNVGTTADDIAFIVFSVSQEACAEINEGLGIDGIPNLSVSRSTYQTNVAVNTPPGVAVASRPDITKVADRAEFCYHGVSSSGANDAYNAYYFLSVMWPQ